MHVRVVQGKDIMLIYIIMHYQQIGAVVAKLLEVIGLWYSTVNFHHENYRNIVLTSQLVIACEQAHL